MLFVVNSGLFYGAQITQNCASISPEKIAKLQIAALQVNLKEAYCHTLAISLEIMLYHDDEPLTFDLVWDNGGWRSATLENVS